MKTLIEKSKQEKFIKQLVTTFGIGTMINALNYVFNIILVRGMPSKEFGILSAIIGLIYLVQLPAVTIQSVYTKKVAENLDKNLDKFKKKSLVRMVILAFAISLVFQLFAGPIADFISIDKKYLIFFWVVIIGSIIPPMTNGFLYGQQKIFTVNIIRLISTIFKLLVGFLAIRITKNPTYPLIAYGGSLMLVGFLAWPFIKFDKNKVELKDDKLNFGNSLTTLLTLVFFNSLIIFDVFLVDPSIRSEYSAVMLLGKIVYFAAIFVTYAVFANLSKESSSKDKKKVFKKSIIFNLVISVPIIIAYYFFKDYITLIALGDKYLHLANYVPVVGLCMAIFSLTFLVINYLLSDDRKLQVVFLLLVSISHVLVIQNIESSLSDFIKWQFFFCLLQFSIICLYSLIIVLRSRRAGK